MLLKVVLFAYQENKRSLSKIAQLCKTVIRYMWLSNEERSSHMAFQRLIASLTDTIDHIFFDITKNLIGDLDINTDIQFIDGTIYDINFTYGYNYPIKGFYSAQEIGYIAQYLMEVMVANDINIIYGKGKRKSKIYERCIGIFTK